MQLIKLEQSGSDFPIWSHIPLSATARHAIFKHLIQQRFTYLYPNSRNWIMLGHTWCCHTFGNATLVETWNFVLHARIEAHMQSRPVQPTIKIKWWCLRTYWFHWIVIIDNRLDQVCGWKEYSKHIQCDISAFHARNQSLDAWCVNSQFC